MRTEVQIDGITYSASSAKELRRRGNSFSAISENAARRAGDLKGRADRIEAELNKPEPLVAGDIVTRSEYRGRYLIVGGLIESNMRKTWWSGGATGFVITSGDNSWLVPRYELTKVGNINDGVK